VPIKDTIIPKSFRDMGVKYQSENVSIYLVKCAIYTRAREPYLVGLWFSWLNYLLIIIGCVIFNYLCLE